MQLFNKRFLPLAALILLCVTTEAQSYPPAWSSSASYAVGDQAQLNGNVIRCTHANTGAFKYDDWELWEVRANTVYLVGVGQTFPSLITGWQYIQNARIAQGAYLHLYISTAKGHFSQTFSSAFSLDHPFGANVSLIGDNLSNIQLNFTGNSSNGLTIDSGHTIALLQNLQLLGNNTGVSGSTQSGINATTNASLPNVSNMTLSNWNADINADHGAVIDVGGTLTVQGQFDDGISATDGGIVDLGMTALSLNGTQNSLSNGLYATNGGRIENGGLTIVNCFYGAFAQQSATISIPQCSISSCTYGASALDASFLDVVGGSFSSNMTDDLQSITGSVIDATSASFSSKSALTDGVIIGP